MSLPDPRRRTTQPPLPAVRPSSRPGTYDPYPCFPAGPGTIELGFDAFAMALLGGPTAVLDGFPGVLWDDLRAGIDDALGRRGVRAAWIPVDEALRPSGELERLLAPFLGGDDPLFGTAFTGSLADLFDPAGLAALAPDATAGLSIVYGPGAALAGWDGPIAFVDLPRNEQQYRARAGVPTNTAVAVALDPRAAYKRSYFVDWPALRRHAASLLPRLDLIVDGQRPHEPAITTGSCLRETLARMARGAFRARPWFEPGPWGGQWIRQQVPGLPQDVPNYAWSFELIAPENGLVLESDGRLLEVSFDWLMAQESGALLGEAAVRFGTEFPIRFDLLDTVGGGNLSVQVHPRPAYVREHFGERFTQDETYYILDCVPDARVYLGFQAGVEPADFRARLERSAAHGTPLDVDRLVQSFPAARGDLFLIPSGTVHCSGAGNLVLEISATPYIFTFKLYDWLRLDLEGRPRPLNLERALENLDFSRQGERVRHELISRPRPLDRGPGWRLEDLPTHPEHFYAVHRLELQAGASLEVATGGSCHVLNLVDGETVRVQVEGAPPQRFAFAETFVVAAAACSYRLTNDGATTARLVKALVRPGAGP